VSEIARDALFEAARGEARVAASSQSSERRARGERRSDSVA
jgi:hypothetical protein